MTGKPGLPMILPAKAVWYIRKFFCRTMHQKNTWTGRRFGNRLQKLRKNPMHSLPERWRCHCRGNFPENCSLQLSGSMCRSILFPKVCVRILPFTTREQRLANKTCATPMHTFSLLPDQSRQMVLGEQRSKRIMPEMKPETVYLSLTKRRESRNWASGTRNSGSG